MKSIYAFIIALVIICITTFYVFKQYHRACLTNESLVEDLDLCIDTFKDIKIHNPEEWDRLCKVDKFTEFIDAYSYYFEE